MTRLSSPLPTPNEWGSALMDRPLHLANEPLVEMAAPTG